MIPERSFSEEAQIALDAQSHIVIASNTRLAVGDRVKFGYSRYDQSNERLEAIVISTATCEEFLQQAKLLDKDAGQETYEALHFYKVVAE